MHNVLYTTEQILLDKISRGVSNLSSSSSAASSGSTEATLLSVANKLDVLNTSINDIKIDVDNITLNTDTLEINTDTLETLTTSTNTKLDTINTSVQSLVTDTTKATVAEQIVQTTALGDIKTKQSDGTQKTQITNGTNTVNIANGSPAGNEFGLITRNIPSGIQEVKLTEVVQDDNVEGVFKNISVGAKHLDARPALTDAVAHSLLLNIQGDLLVEEKNFTENVKFNSEGHKTIATNSYNYSTEEYTPISVVDTDNGKALPISTYNPIEEVYRIPSSIETGDKNSQTMAIVDNNGNQINTFTTPFPTVEDLSSAPSNGLIVGGKFNDTPPTLNENNFFGFTLNQRGSLRVENSFITNPSTVNSQIAIANTSQMLLATNANRRGFILQNLSNIAMFVSYNTTGVINGGFEIPSKSMYESPNNMNPSSQINIICSVATSKFTYLEY